MRDSVRNQHRQYERQAGRRHRRIALWLLPVVVAIGLGGGIFWYNDSVSAQIATRQNEMAESDVEFARLQPILIQQRIEREKAENVAVRDLVYQHTIAGYMTPPKLTSNQCNYLKEHNDTSQPDVLVNKQYCLVPLGFVPKVQTIYGATLQSSAAAAYKNMIDAANSAGHNIGASSSYRSYADQVATYLYWVRLDGRVQADTYSAYPGYSEHQTGLAVDLQTPDCVLGCFGLDPAYSWMKAHAYQYGFIERYPKGMQEITGYSYEPWHWRYVGIDTATKYKESDKKTLEQFWAID